MGSLESFQLQEWGPKLAHVQGNWLAPVSKHRVGDGFVGPSSSVIRDPGSLGLCSLGFRSPEADSFPCGFL